MTLLFLYFIGTTSANSQQQVPYSINFSTDDYSEWTVVDNSETPGTTWTYMARGGYNQGNYYPCFKISMDYSSACDDYLISPALALTAGVNYTISTITCSDSSGNGLEVSLSLGTSNEDVSTFTAIEDLNVVEGFNNSTAQKTSLTVENNGNYYIAFHATSPVFNSSTLVFSFEITGENGGGGGEDPDQPVIVNVPYNIDLVNDNTGWTEEDNNGDGQTWTFTNNFGASMNPVISSSSQHNDDYVSPGINLEAGKTYEITTNVTVQEFPNSNDNVQLLQSVEGSQLTYLYTLDLSVLGENIQSTFFNVSESGVYHFSFRNLSTTGGNTLAIHSFSIAETTSVVTTEETIFETDFSGSSPLWGWMTENNNGDNVTWSILTDLSGVTYNGNTASGAADDWLITPAISIVNGTDYIIEYTFAQAGAFDADIVEICYGTGQTSGSMTRTLANESYDFGNGSETRSVRMTAGMTGSIYIGFHITTPDMNGTMSLTKVTVKSVPKATPMPVSNLSVTSNYNRQSVRLEWTNPALDTSQTPINEPLNINITENGSLIHTVTGTEAGAEESYEFNPAIPFTGNVTYAVTALIGNNPSESVEQTICLDDMQGDSILAKSFSLDTQQDFEQWVIEDKNGGRTWTYEQYNQQMSIPMTSSSNNDWAITPGVEMSTDLRYVLIYELKTTIYYGADLDVTIGNQQTASAQTRVLETYDNLKQNGMGTYATSQFSVDNDGTYYFGFHAGNVENGLSIRNVRLMYIGENEELVVVEEFPYSQNFDSSLDLPEGWTVESGNPTYGFQVVNIADYLGLPNFDAHSTPNALYANAGILSARHETVFTPMFAMKGGTEYNVSFWLQMPSSNNKKQTLQVYALDAHNESLATGTPVFEIVEGDIQDWEKQEFNFSVDQDTELCFMIRVTCNLSNSGQIAIDDFTFEEYVPESTPSAPVNLRGSTSYPSSIILNWNYPETDIDGQPLPANSIVTVTFSDQYGYIGEQKGNPGTFGSFMYDYNYSSNYNGQLIIKGQSQMGDLIGEASTCVITVTSYGNDLLKELAFDSSTTSPQNWSGSWDIDDDMTFTSNGTDEWLFSPAITLEKGKTYYAVCEVETGSGQTRDLSIALASEPNESSVDETLKTFEGLELSDYSQIELCSFTADEEQVHLALHAVNESGDVRIRNLRVYRIFAQNEAEPLPYFEDFEDRVNIEERTGMTNKWGRRTNSASLFNITTMPDNTLPAHSGSYAAVAEEFSIASRIETLFTPMFEFELGGVYEISYWLYMPGNSGRYTYGNVLISPTQTDEGETLPVVQVMDAPLDNWTKMTFRYTHEIENIGLCFWFYFVSEEASAGIIAIDDFSIEKVDQLSISTGQEADNKAAYYVNETSTLVLSEGYTDVTIFDAQGKMLGKSYHGESQVDLSWLGNGLYIISVQGNDKAAQTIKVVK